jgi:O-antigen ligase
MALSQTKLSISSSPSHLLPLYLGTALACSYAVTSLPGRYSLAALLLAALFGFVEPSRLHPRLFYLITATALIIPPLYPSALGGEIPIHVSSLLLLALVLIILFRLELSDLNWDSIGEAGMFLLLAMALSLPFAYWLSGLQVGIQSSLRFLLVLQPWFLYAWVCTTGWVSKDEQLSTFVRFLLIVGAAAAGYGIIDFYTPFQFSHPFADQYIYLQGEKIRRAQGLFYEASSFGNMCAFFLSLSLLQLYSFRKGASRLHLAGLLLLVGVFFTALFLAYSRGSWVNVVVTAGVFLVCQRAFQIRRLAALFVLLTALVFLLYQVSPQVVTNFFEWRLANLLEFWSDPGFATSGRWETWERLITFFADHPWLLIFGIGYKSLPYTDLFGASLIADNGFLSLAFETGIIGFVAFLNLNWVIFRSLHKTSQHQNSTIRRYATFMFAFWCGEMVQMITGDIFTYWRNVILYFSLMAFVQRLSRQDRATQEM